MKRSIAALILMIGFAGPAVAQSLAPGEGEIRAAIADGTRDKGKREGIILRDSAAGFAAALGSSGGAQSSKGFWVEAYTPLTWIQQKASTAAKEYHPMTSADVTPELLEPVFRVVAHPDMPNTVNAKGMTGTSSVQHVVLRDESRKIVIQPIFKEPFDEEASNAMGGKAAFTGLTLKFPLEGLRELRGKDGNGEFFITIIGESGAEKNFKVKKKHFDDLK